MIKNIAVIKYLLALAFCILHVSSFAQKSKNQEIDSIDFYLSIPDYEQAIVHLDKAIEKNPSASLLAVRGMSRLEIGEYEDALEDFRRSLALNPSSDTALYNMGYVHYLKGDFDSSIIYYDSALLINENNLYYLIARGDSFLELDNFNLAEVDYRKAISIDYESDLGYYGMAMVHYFSDQYDSAKYYLSLALTYDPFDSDYYAQRAMCKYILDEEESALKDLNMALNIDGVNIDARSLRATLYLDNNMTEEALLDLNVGLKYDSLNTEMLEERGDIHLRNTDYEAALLDFSRLLSTSPENDFYYTIRDCAFSTRDIMKMPRHALQMQFHKMTKMNSTSFTRA